MRRNMKSQHPSENDHGCGISTAHSGLRIQSHQIQQALKCLRLPLALQVDHLRVEMALMHERDRLELALCDFFLHRHARQEGDTQVAHDALLDGFETPKRTDNLVRSRRLPERLQQMGPIGTALFGEDETRVRQILDAQFRQVAVRSIWPDSQVPPAKARGLVPDPEGSKR